MGAASSRKKLVFVVAIEATIADTLGLILRAEGFAVRVFYNASSAFDHAHEETPDLILSDIVMPHMDGFVLAAKLHCAVSRLPDLTNLRKCVRLRIACRMAEQWRGRCGDTSETGPSPDPHRQSESSAGRADEQEPIVSNSEEEI